MTAADEPTTQADTLSAGRIGERQARLLRIMGVDVWQLRREAAAASSGSAPSTGPTAQPPASHVTQPDSISAAGSGAPVPPAKGSADAAGAAAAVDDPGGDPENAPPAATAAPVEFICIVGGFGQLLLPALAERDRNFVRDLMQYLDWRHGGSTAAGSAKRFKWPQLATSTGTPARPLQVFLRKHAPAQLQWFVVDSGVYAEVENWLPELDAKVQVLPVLDAVAQPALKRDLWQLLNAAK
ncbi:MAG: hypothetical protein AAF529_17625 [Pseudomonadota bacterium]